MLEDKIRYVHEHPEVYFTQEARKGGRLSPTIFSFDRKMPIKKFFCGVGRWKQKNFFLIDKFCRFQRR